MTTPAAIILTLGDADIATPSSGKVGVYAKTDGLFTKNDAGVVAPLGGGGSPGGDNNQVQFNIEGNFDASPALTFDISGTPTLTIGNIEGAAINFISSNTYLRLVNNAPGLYIGVGSINEAVSVVFGSIDQEGLHQGLRISNSLLGDAVFLRSTAPGSSLKLLNNASSVVLSIGPSTSLFNGTTNGTHNGDLDQGGGGKIYRLANGNPTDQQGNATLTDGVVTVAQETVGGASHIFLQRKTTSGTPGHLTYTIDPGVSFTINSTEATDASVVHWMIIETYD